MSESIGSTEESWSDDIEEVLKAILYNTALIQKEHKKNYIGYQKQLKLLQQVAKSQVMADLHHSSSQR